jgi:hypothetical protein
MSSSRQVQNRVFRPCSHGVLALTGPVMVMGTLGVGAGAVGSCPPFPLARYRVARGTASRSPNHPGIRQRTGPCPPSCASIRVIPPSAVGVDPVQPRLHFPKSLRKQKPAARTFVSSKTQRQRAH